MRAVGGGRGRRSYGVHTVLTYEFLKTKKINK